MSLTYKSAQELKDAGFPQDKTEYILRKYSLAENPLKLSRPPKGMEVTVLSGSIEWEVAYPTLPELIEKCGDDIQGIYHDVNKREWLASNFDENVFRSRTLFEAVKKLWIKLNE